MKGRRNCNRCTRWRPITDFPPGGRSKPVPHIDRVYPRRVCAPCWSAHRKWVRRQWTAKQRMRQAELNEQHRRRIGIKPAEPTGLKKRNDQKRESARKARRAAGIPARPVGARNSGHYGMQDVR